MKILVIGGISRSLINFRGPLLQTMLAKGHEVIACAGEPREDVTAELREWGVGFVPVALYRSGMRPWQDVRTCWELWRLFKKIQPDVVLAYTIKPVIWGGLAARFAGTLGIYSMIEGLGYAFTPGNGLHGRVAGFFATCLYRLSLKYSRKVFFLNPDDVHDFTTRRLVQQEQCVLVNGTGIDLEHYGVTPLPASPRFLMICRLLRDKGVREYVQAARSIKKHYPETLFRLAGALDANPSSVSAAELEDWHNEGVIEYLGQLEDVRPAFADCSIYVLPSYYREGTPRTVLEAMSMGRAIITTDAPGCRETVVNGDNGFLVPVRSIEALETAMLQFIVDPDLAPRMGLRSRQIAEEKYDVHKVNAVMLQEMGIV
ncbi:glycosyltransferase family 4 protein [Desulfobulbus alkaliphilus]|uniref:glycosyltransferase family 4 protein n=1 Tax=Desulfobulbus alkaliphilus TaxID=869814 RepID=UPI0019648E8E|nr:glycosyltransferase family 4 protein [Desulfobulbus alkaliphilus]MBM9538611.1 glycosyltransferase family 4 protein [Desulfobulbus alkaliphilus]